MQQLHYVDTSAAERFNLLQKLRAQGHHVKILKKFQIGNKVLISNKFYISLYWHHQTKFPVK